MAYTLIATQTLTASASSVTFSSIPQTYKDLVLEVTAQSSGTATIVGSQFRVNGDTGSNYSYTFVSGNGTAASSGRGSNTVYAIAPGVSSSNISTGSLTFMSYSNTNVNKTILMRMARPDTDTAAYVNLWRSTSAITSITVVSPDNGSASVPFIAGSTFKLWGVS